MSECIFCRIASGEIPATVVQRGEEFLTIADVNPQAPEHLLVMPIAHAANLEEYVRERGSDAVGRLFAAASKLGRARGAAGFRLVVNTGEEGGQTVDHLHVHILAGRRMGWPPG